MPDRQPRAPHPQDDDALHGPEKPPHPAEDDDDPPATPGERVPIRPIIRGDDGTDEEPPGPEFPAQ